MAYFKCTVGSSSSDIPPFEKAIGMIRPRPGETNGDHIQISTDGENWDEYYYNEMNGDYNAKNIDPFFKIWYSSPYWQIVTRSFVEDENGNSYFPGDFIATQHYQSMELREWTGWIYSGS